MPVKPLKGGEYIETDTGNKVSRRALVYGTQHIILGGKSVIEADVCIRGDLHRQTLPQQPQHSSSSSISKLADAEKSSTSSTNSSISVSIGRYTYLSRGCILRPPSRLHRGVHAYFPLKLGDHVFVGEKAVVEAASIGNHVQIGREAVVGSMAIIKDYVVILDGAVVPSNMVVPSWSVVGGCPARVVGELGEGYGIEGADGGLARERYRNVGR